MSMNGLIAAFFFGGAAIDVGAGLLACYLEGRLQGLLENTDTHYPLGRSYAPRQRPTVGSFGGVCS